MPTTSSWNIDRLLVGFAISIIGMMALLTVPQSDTWWLLRAGQDFWQQGSIVTTDTYSFTITGLEWPNHEWLSQVVMYAFYGLGGLPGLVLGMALVLCLTWYGVYKLCYGPPHVRSIAVLIAVIGNVMSWSLRPHIFSMGFTVLVLLLISKRRLHWWIPLVMLIWVNFHGGFVIGLVLLAAAGAAAVLKYRDQVVHWIILGIVSALATLVNPHGYEIWLFTFSYLDHPAKNYIAEWAAPNLSSLSGMVYLGFVAITIVCLWLSRKKWRSHMDLTLVFSSILLGIMATSALRHLSLFVLVAAPIMSLVFRDRQPFDPVPLQKGRFNQLILGIVSGLLIFVLVVVWRDRTIGLEPELLSSLDQCEGPMYNSYDIGGELIWFKRDRPVFIDNRHDPYPQDFMFQVIEIHDRGTYEDVFAEYAIRCAVIERESPLAEALLEDQWQSLYQDSTYTILAKP